MLNKLLALLLAIALVAGGVQTLRHSKAVNRADKATNLAATYKGRLDDEIAANAVLVASGKAQRLASERRAATMAVTIKKEQEVNDQLRKALRDNPEWANAPVPAGVLDALNSD